MNGPLRKCLFTLIIFLLVTYSSSRILDSDEEKKVSKKPSVNFNLVDVTREELEKAYKICTNSKVKNEFDSCLANVETTTKAGTRKKFDSYCDAYKDESSAEIFCAVRKRALKINNAFKSVKGLVRKPIWQFETLPNIDVSLFTKRLNSEYKSCQEELTKIRFFTCLTEKKTKLMRKIHEAYTEFCQKNDQQKICESSQKIVTVDKSMKKVLSKVVRPTWQFVLSSEVKKEVSSVILEKSFGLLNVGSSLLNSTSCERSTWEMFTVCFQKEEQFAEEHLINHLAAFCEKQNDVTAEKSCRENGFKDLQKKLRQSFDTLFKHYCPAKSTNCCQKRVNGCQVAAINESYKLLDEIPPLPRLKERAFSSLDLLSGCSNSGEKYSQCLTHLEVTLTSQWLLSCSEIKNLTMTCEISARSMATESGRAAKAIGSLFNSESEQIYLARIDTFVEKIRNQTMNICKLSIARSCSEKDPNIVAGNAKAIIIALRKSICSSQPLPMCFPSSSTSPPSPTLSAKTTLSTRNPVKILSCSNNSNEIEECIGLCIKLKENNKNMEEEQKQEELSRIFLWIGIVLIILAFISFILLKCLRKKKVPKEVTPDPKVKALREKTAKQAAFVARRMEKHEEQENETEEPPKKNGKLRQAQKDFELLRAHVKKTRAQHKSDTRSDKFKKKGPIFIPRSPPVLPAAQLPDNIVLDNVIYDETLNELWDIGSDVDDIELDESFRIEDLWTLEDDKDDEKKKSEKKTGNGKSKSVKSEKKMEKSREKLNVSDADKKKAESVQKSESSKAGKGGKVQNVVSRKSNKKKSNKKKSEKSKKVASRSEKNAEMKEKKRGKTMSRNSKSSMKSAKKIDSKKAVKNGLGMEKSGDGSVDGNKKSEKKNMKSEKKKQQADNMAKEVKDEKSQNNKMDGSKKKSKKSEKKSSR